MKKLVFAALATVMTIGAVSPAAAWSYVRCKAAADMTNFLVSNKTLANNCHAFIADKGIISKGDHQGDVWAEAYPGEHFTSITSDHVRGKVTSPFDNRKMHIVTYGNDALRTKIIDGKNTDGFLKEQNLKMHYIDSTSTDYKVSVKSNEFYSFQDNS